MYFQPFWLCRKTFQTWSRHCPYKGCRVGDIVRGFFPHGGLCPKIPEINDFMRELNSYIAHNLIKKATNIISNYN